MKLKIAADTGALVSLQLSGLLEASFKYSSFMIGCTVKKELEDMTRVGNTIGEAAHSVLEIARTGTIALIDYQRESGEEDALVILKDYDCDILISDDIKFAKRYKDYNIRFSVFIIYLLFHMGAISKERAREAVNKIFEKREWSENLIYLHAKELLDEEDF